MNRVERIEYLDTHEIVFQPSVEEKRMKEQSDRIDKALKGQQYQGYRYIVRTLKEAYKQ